MYTIRIKEKKASKPEELCSFETIEDAINMFDDICNDYYNVKLVRNNRITVMEQLNHDYAD